MINHNRVFLALNSLEDYNDYITVIDKVYKNSPCKRKNLFRITLKLILISVICKYFFLDSCIYAMGGFDSANYQSSVEKLDPR